LLIEPDLFLADPAGAELGDARREAPFSSISRSKPTAFQAVSFQRLHLRQWRNARVPEKRAFEELRKRYWGQHLWARGYFCATVGAVDEETIKKYIESQKWDEDEEGFKITAPTKP